MSDAAATSKPTQDAHVGEISAPPPPPPYSYQGQEPPPPYTYNPPKPEAAGAHPPPTGYVSFNDIIPETSSDTSPLVSSCSFDDQTVRRGFVRKVFSILTLQLLFTFSVVCVFTFSDVVKTAVQNNIWAYLSSFIIFMVVAILLGCCASFRRRYPWNITALAIITLSLSYMVGTVASYHDTASVVITMGVTLVISVAIIAFSAQTHYEFTVCYGLLLILLVDFIMFGFLCTFLYSYVAVVAYGCLGALLYSLFLMIDCQLMMGRMRFRLDPEEYIYAALTIYLDIILIFLYLLGGRR